MCLRFYTNTKQRYYSYYCWWSSRKVLPKTNHRYKEKFGCPRVEGQEQRNPYPWDSGAHGLPETESG